RRPSRAVRWSARSARLSADQLGYAARAAATARSTSAAEPSATWAMVSSVAGFSTAMVPLPAGATPPPPLNTTPTSATRPPLSHGPSRRRQCAPPSVLVRLTRRLARAGTLPTTVSLLTASTSLHRRHARDNGVDPSVGVDGFVHSGASNPVTPPPGR